MKKLVLLLVLVLDNCMAQPGLPGGSILRDPVWGDSIVIYQCHAEHAIQEIRQAQGQSVNVAAIDMSITEKFVVRFYGDSCTVQHYTSPVNSLPNRRFSGLKIREKSYWQFSLVNTSRWNAGILQKIREIEESGRECTEYDFAVSVHTRNQVIFKKGKRFRQLILPDKKLLSDLFRPGGAQ